MTTNPNSSKKLKRVALVQSAYIPWKGFFDLIGQCDEYIVYDSAAFSKNHWHNRNRIKTSNATQWLTIPVKTAGRLGQRIDEVEVTPGWADSHWARIAQSYRSAPFFAQLGPTIETMYKDVCYEHRLTDINEKLLRSLATLLELDVRIVRDTSYMASGRRTDRVLSICQSAGATHYLSGPSAMAYLEVEKFVDAGIVLEWMSYGPYPHYEQLHGTFEHNVSIIDVLFSLGIRDWHGSIEAPKPV